MCACDAEASKNWARISSQRERERGGRRRAGRKPLAEGNLLPLHRKYRVYIADQVASHAKRKALPQCLNKHIEPAPATAGGRAGGRGGDGRQSSSRLKPKLMRSLGRFTQFKQTAIQIAGT